jgi:hypothetical protein
MSHVHPFVLLLRRIAPRLLEPRVFAPLFAGIFAIFSLVSLHHMAAHPKGRAELVRADAAHYVAIAKDFAAGNFSMDYVARRPHRQPLYPALLAVAMRASGGDLFAMGCVNVALSTLGFLVLYFGLLRLGHSRGISAAVGGLFLLNPMLHALTSRHLMTEPLHVLLMLLVLFTALEWLRSGRAWLPPLLGAEAGLDYLTRPNGLFVMAALLGALLLADGVDWAGRRTTAGEFARKLALYAVAAGVFVLVATPSWLPRLLVYGDPIHHGYLSNYLWVDTYAQGHVGQKYAIYHFRDYASTHTALDAARRMAVGAWEVAVAIPLHTEGTTGVLCLLALGGALLAALRGPRAYRVLALFGLMQLLPLMWTHVANPNARVPYAATFPFELVFAAFTLAWLWRHAFPRGRESLFVPWGEAAADFVALIKARRT